MNFSIKHASILSEGKEVRELFDKRRDRLNDQERLIIELRYGFKNGKPMVMADIADCLKITRQRVSLVTKLALKKLKYEKKPD